MLDLMLIDVLSAWILHDNRVISEEKLLLRREGKRSSKDFSCFIMDYDIFSPDQDFSGKKALRVWILLHARGCSLGLSM